MEWFQGRGGCQGEADTWGGGAWRRSMEARRERGAVILDGVSSAPQAGGADLGPFSHHPSPEGVQYLLADRLRPVRPPPLPPAAPPLPPPPPAAPPPPPCCPFLPLWFSTTPSAAASLLHSLLLPLHLCPPRSTSVPPLHLPPLSNKPSTFGPWCRLCAVLYAL